MNMQKQKNIRKVGLGLVLCAFLIPVAFASAIEYGGIGGAPAYPNPENNLSKTAFVHTITPGTVKDDGIILVNNTAETKILKVYAADSALATGGAFACEQESSTKDFVGKWIELEQSQVTIPAGGTELVPFTIAVPNSAGVGEHAGCILVQEDKRNKEGQQAGVSLSIRTGVRVYITIPGRIVREVEIVGFETTAREDGTFLLQPKVKNLGNVSIETDLQVVTKNMFGVGVATHGGKRSVVRGATSDWNFVLDKPFWGGMYRSNFDLEYDKGKDASTGVASGEALTMLRGPSVWFFSSPAPLALAIETAVFALIIFGLFLLLLARKRTVWIKTKWVPYVIQEGDDIKKVSDKFGISWKVLVKANKLEPPYLLSAKDVINVPPATSGAATMSAIRKPQAVTHGASVEKETEEKPKSKPVVRKRKVKKE